MPARLVLIHTVPPLIEVFTRLAAVELPGVQLLHVLDEPLLEHVRAQGRIGAEDVARLAAHVAEAALVGAAAVLVTCSTVSPAVDQVQAGIPVFKIDAAMVAAAVQAAAQRGGRIGVVATNRTTLEPTRAQLLAEAARAGKTVKVEMHLVEGALPALLAGDGAAHDVLVAAAVEDAARSADAIVLAQASMARVLDCLPAALPAPVLASPQLALAQVAALLAARAVDQRGEA